MHNMTTPAVINKFKGHFTRYGIPQELVSDNSPQFISEEFQSLTKTWIPPSIKWQSWSSCQASQKDHKGSPDNQQRFLPSTPWYPWHPAGRNGLKTSSMAHEQKHKDHITIIDQATETPYYRQSAGEDPESIGMMKILWQNNKRSNTTVKGR